MKRFIAFVLTFCITISLLPAAHAAAADTPETYSLANGSIEVIVSAENGGFVVRTADGDSFNKDDNNKDLLFHDGEYDTSFTSFEVTYPDNSTRDYVFGGNYSFLGLGGNDLTVTKEDSRIVSTWSVDDLTFTQILQPVWNEGANEHGAVAVNYLVTNGKAEPVTVRARLLLDTALGSQDYGYYELADTVNGGYDRIEKECIVDGADIPANFFAYDNYANPSVTAYTMNDSSTGGKTPYQAAFGHWNNLASTVFDFVPDTDLAFTNRYNKEYQTADSAYALYYDLGTVPANSAEAEDFLTYYGLYSNVGVAGGDSFSVNITSPSSLALSADKSSYIGAGGEADGVFEVTTNIGNLIQEGAQDYDEIAVAVYVDEGFDPLNDSGVSAGSSYSNPYRIGIDSFRVGEVKQLVWRFGSEVFSETGYRKITFKVYNMPESANNQLLLENVIGSASTYVLCPGGNGSLPEILFTGASPEILYNEGTRHLYLTGSGFSMLRDTSRYVLKAYPASAGAAVSSYTIDPDNIIFTQDDDGNTIIDVVMTETMALGEYDLVFEWASGRAPAGIAEKLMAPALKFTVSDDKSYKNDYYGIVAVIKPDAEAGQWEYHMKAFSGEKQLSAFKESFEGDVLIELRGEFTVVPDANREYVTSCSAISSSDSDPVNINGVLDVVNGDIRGTVAEKNGKTFVYVDMDGQLLTSYSRTPVWEGVANLTPLVYGQDIGLVAYDNKGERMTQANYLTDKYVTLMWSSEYKILQTVGGMIVDFRYGQFGVMLDTNTTTSYPNEEMGYTLSFGASLDLSSLMPGGKSEDSDSGAPSIETIYNRKYNGDEREATLTANDPSEEAKTENEENKTEPVGKINIEDIMYGLNRGYMGVNAEAELTLPKYVDALPELGGALSINTINGYSFGVTGTTKTQTFEMEFELVVRSAPDSGAPVPDKIYFYIAGFEPGVNVDGAGVLWLTGGGGGIDKLYDTIFSSGLPPLTLLLTANFDIMKVMSAKADLSLSLRGFRLTLSDVELKGTDVTVINSGKLAVEWYPDFYFLISASVSLLDIIDGSAYIVVDDDYFEFFLRVGVKIPKKVPVVGGIVLTSADLGANNDRIWGALSLLGLKLGICYYWGGDFSFGTGQDTIEPNYPELLGLGDEPVGYDEDTGQTLYMRVGTNLSIAARSEAAEDPYSAGLVLMDASAPSIRSDLSRTTHVMNLGSGAGGDYALTIDFPENGPKTIAEAQSAVTIKKPDGTDYTLVFYDQSLGNAAGANANLTCDETTGESSVSVSITNYIAGDWTITTASAADMVLYDVAALPAVDDFTAARNGGSLDLTWTGSKLDDTNISFYITGDKGGASGIGDMGTYIGSVDTPVETGQTVSLPIPSDLQTGTYYVRMVVSKEEEVNDLYLAEGASAGADFTFDYVNANQPDQPDGATIENAGNLMLSVGVSDDQASDKYDGYAVNVYEDGDNGLQPTVLTGLTFDRGESITVGGTYVDANGDTFGLTAGNSYVVGVSAYKVINQGLDDEQYVYSTEKQSAAVTLREADPPEITFRADAGYTSIGRTVKVSESETDAFSVDTFTTNSVKFTLLPDQDVASGKWYIDSLSPEDVTNITDSAGLPIEKYLPDGDHTVTFTGRNAAGDSFTYTKLFSVDTTPPRLMLTSPTNGSYFSESGDLTVTGITDTEALLTVRVDGRTVVSEKTLADMGHAIGNDGTFSFDLPVDPGVSSHAIEIIAEDEIGNSSTATAAVYNIGLSDISGLDILKDGVLYTDNNIMLDDSAATTGTLSLAAATGNGSMFTINNEDMVSWSAIAKEGSASVGRDGAFTASPGSIGFVSAEFHVADGADMTAAVTFGAETLNNPDDGSYRLSLGSTIGGTVSGEGYYFAGASVALTAVPGSGYVFSGWSSSNGGSFANADSASTTFTMPAGDTVVTAAFVHRSAYYSASEGTYRFAKGETASITLPSGLLEESGPVVPYYTLNGEKHYVTESAVIDGKLTFVAPVTGTYGYEKIETAFTDISGHWALDYIGFAAARGLLNGIGNGRFDPDGKMTRAMFVTILARLEGADTAGYESTAFKDVASGSWYASAVAWARETGIVKGVSETEFAPDTPVTREQMAVMLANYIAYKGYRLGSSETDAALFADSGGISDWAADAVSQLQSLGIMNGRSGNLFDPQGIATRAEGCAVFERLIEAILK